jgi:phage baseplate assembly protein W
MAEKAISLPFLIDPYGRVASTQSQSKIWSDKVKSVLGTTLRERVMRPNFGTLIPYSLFNTENTAAVEIESEVNKAFTEQLALLTLEKVNVTSDPYTNVLTIEVIYGLPNDEIVSTVVGLVLVQGTKPIYEELL